MFHWYSHVNHKDEEPEVSLRLRRYAEMFQRVWALEIKVLGWEAGVEYRFALA